MLGQLGLRVGNRSAVHSSRTAGPPACAEDTRAHCDAAEEVRPSRGVFRVFAGVSVVVRAF